MLLCQSLSLYLSLGREDTPRNSSLAEEEEEDEEK